MNKMKEVKDFLADLNSDTYLRLVDNSPNYDGYSLFINQKKLKNFGSCSYMGLDANENIRQGGIDAIKRYGTQFSFSPIYVSTNLYQELKQLYEQIFEAPTLLSSTTTLGHLAAIPIIASRGGIFVEDRQVHNSVKMALRYSIKRKDDLQVINHNDMNRLENILENNNSCPVWYFCDGIYSMYGDLAPITELNQLKKKYSHLYLYIDDAHATGCYGKHGKGYALSTLEDLDRVVVAQSHAKSFCSGGGSFVIKDAELRQEILHTGPTNIFSGPMQPATTGASIASAKFHLSSEHQKLQTRLFDKIKLRNQLINELKLPVYGTYESPICFIKVGEAISVKKIVLKLMDIGYYVNATHYPAVPKNKAGIRITTTTLQKDEDIKNLLSNIKNLIN